MPQLVAISGVLDRKKLREDQKEILMQRFRQLTDRLAGWIEETIDARDPRAFSQVLQGLDRLDRISGNAVGESSSAPQGPQITVNVDLKSLLARILDKPLALTNGSGQS